MIQAVVEVVLMLSVATFLGYKIGTLMEQRKSRKLQTAFNRQAQELAELTFDLNYCTQTRRRIQSQLSALQKRLEIPSEVSHAVVNAHGKVVIPKAEGSRSDPTKGA